MAYRLFTKIWQLLIAICIACLYFACQDGQKSTTTSNSININQPYLVVLGIAQDAGYPQAGCMKDCCRALWSKHSSRKMVTCLAIVDPVASTYWIIEATPDFKDQLFLLQTLMPEVMPILPSGIFLTHGHIGHYTGLMELGREVMGASNIPVYAMPRMRTFLTEHGPWSQLVKLENIKLHNLEADSTVVLNERIQITPILVPHRDEYTETVAYRIEGKTKSALFIPDIDKWERWERNILKEIQEVDLALLDGSFYQNGEIPGRDMSEIPHPFMEESIQLFKALSKEAKSRVHFIHFNHTNPVLREKSSERAAVVQHGFRIANEGQTFPL